MRWPRPITAGLKVDHSQLGEFVSPLAYEKKEKEQRPKERLGKFLFSFLLPFSMVPHAVGGGGRTYTRASYMVVLFKTVHGRRNISCSSKVPTCLGSLKSILHPPSIERERQTDTQLLPLYRVQQYHPLVQKKPATQLAYISGT